MNDSAVLLRGSIKCGHFWDLKDCKKWKDMFDLKKKQPIIVILSHMLPWLILHLPFPTFEFSLKWGSAMLFVMFLH